MQHERVPHKLANSTECCCIEGTAMTLNEMVDCIMDCMSADEQTLLSWLAKNHAGFDLTHLWVRTARWVIEYRESGGRPRFPKPLTPTQFEEVRVVAGHLESLSTDNDRVEVITAVHLGHVYIYRYKAEDTGLLAATLRAHTDSR